MIADRIAGLTEVDATINDGVCVATIHSAGGRNTITPRLVRDLEVVLERCGGAVSVLVLEGNEHTFCAGADFAAVADRRADAPGGGSDEPEKLYDLWLGLSLAPFVVVSHVRGRANAGGIGLVAASDLVLAQSGAVFSLSELLFGLYPALVLPFLARRTGWQAAHTMTLTTAPVAAPQAKGLGLVDDHSEDSARLLKRHLRRLRLIPAGAVGAYKAYMAGLGPDLVALRDPAGAANRAMFADPVTVGRITRFQADGVYPWEAVQ